MGKVSVIIPIYNRLQYLPAAIGSVLNQTYQDFEIIVVDDGSTEDVKGKISEYIKQNPSKKIKYFYQENKGVSAARNRGIKEATGEYIAFLDSDDIWVPEKLSLQTEYLAKNKTIDVVFGDAVEQHENSNGAEAGQKRAFDLCKPHQGWIYINICCMKISSFYKLS